MTLAGRGPLHQKITPAFGVLLPASDAAALLHLRPQTLATMRVRGSGPKFVKFGGRILYRLEDLETWVASHVRTSTADSRGDSVAA